MHTILIASGASRKSLAIARSLRTAGYRVAALFHRKHPFMYSRLFDKAIFVNVDRESEEYADYIFRSALMSKADLLIPVDFVDVVAVSRHLDLFDGVAKVASPPYKAVAEVSDKAGLADLISRLGLTYPRTIKIENENDIDGISLLETPFVIKGIGDASKPEYIPSRDLALQIVKKRVPCIIQEFITGDGHGYYAVAVNGRPFLEFMHRRVVELDPIGGPSMMACKFYDPELASLGRRVVEHLEWTGPIMVEFRRESESGDYYVMEINPKFWGSIDLPVSLGYHFPAALAKYYLEGEEAAERFSRTLNTREKGCYAWFLDSMRYLVKDPQTWLFMLKYTIKNLRMTDVDLTDPSRLLVHLLVALRRLRVERIRALRLWAKDLPKIYWWLREARRRIREGNLTLSLDLDGTLVDLGVDWIMVKHLLIQHGLMCGWSGIMMSLYRLRFKDQKDYWEASKLIEKFEIEAAEKLRPNDLTVQVESLIPKLKDLGMKVCLVTKQSRRAAELALENLRLKDLFDLVVSREEEITRRGQLEICLRKTHAASLFHIGDMMVDIVSTYRIDGLPLCKANRRYNLIRSFRLGAPASMSLPTLLGFLRGLADQNYTSYQSE